MKRSENERIRDIIENLMDLRRNCPQVYRMIIGLIKAIHKEEEGEEMKKMVKQR